MWVRLIIVLILLMFCTGFTQIPELWSEDDVSTENVDYVVHPKNGKYSKLSDWFPTIGQSTKHSAKGLLEEKYRYSKFVTSQRHLPGSVIKDALGVGIVVESSYKDRKFTDFWSGLNQTGKISVLILAGQPGYSDYPRSQKVSKPGDTQLWNCGVVHMDGRSPTAVVFGAPEVGDIVIWTKYFDGYYGWWEYLEPKHRTSVVKSIKQKNKPEPKMSREYKEAIDQAEYHLSQMNYSRAISAIKPYADKGYRIANALMGDVYRVEGNKAMAYQCYLKGGDTHRALFGLGVLHYHGSGGAQKDIKRSVSLFEQSAKNGGRAAMNQLGEMYYVGRDVQKSRSKAFKFWKEAIALSYRPALKNFCKYGPATELMGSRTGILCEQNGYGIW